PLGRQRLAPVEVADRTRAWSHQDLEVDPYVELIDGLAIGPDEPRPGPAAGLQPDGQMLAGLLARELDSCAPLVIGVEDVHRRGLLRVEAAQLEAAIVNVDETVRLPLEVERMDLLPAEDHGIVDRLARRADRAAAQRLARPEDSVDLAGPFAGPDL